jgi:hypothetical protein
MDFGKAMQFLAVKPACVATQNQRAVPRRRYNVSPMDPANNAEYEALQRNAHGLRKELGLDQPLDRLGLLRTEVKILVVG